MRLLSTLLPPSHTFFDDFENMARHVQEAANRLVSFSAEWPQSREHANAIRQHEHDADEIAHDALRRLDRTFQTPIYREDIHDLIQALDTIIDILKATSDRFEVFHVQEVHPSFVTHARLLVTTAGRVCEMMKVIRTDRKLAAVRPILVAIHEQENQANDLNGATISAFFQESEDAIDLLRWKELFDLMLRAFDQCEDVANIVERIVIQNG